MDTGRQRLRIVCRDGLPHSTTVYVVQPDGTETPITDTVTAVTVRVRHDQLTTACIEFDGVEVDMVGEDITAPAV